MLRLFFFFFKLCIYCTNTNPIFFLKIILIILHHLPGCFLQEPNISHFHRFIQPTQHRNCFSTLRSQMVLFCPVNISGPQQEARSADRHSPAITRATFPRNGQKSLCASQNTFSPPLGPTSDVCELSSLPSVMMLSCVHGPVLCSALTD